MSDEMHALVLALAQRRGISAAQMIREATAFYLGWTIGRVIGKAPNEMANYDEVVQHLAGGGPAS